MKSRLQTLLNHTRTVLPDEFSACDHKINWNKFVLNGLFLWTCVLLNDFNSPVKRAVACMCDCCGCSSVGKEQTAGVKQGSETAYSWAFIWIHHFSVSFFVCLFKMKTNGSLLVLIIMKKCFGVFWHCSGEVCRQKTHWTPWNKVRLATWLWIWKPIL